ncbi:MAG: flagellar motor protein MotB [Bdellovibrionaceae bacterium]|nr:flagellar motor protein MotB [Pseudobdellovibrionaceae bacterium]
MGVAKKWSQDKEEQQNHSSLNIVESESSDHDDYHEDISGGHGKKVDEGEGPWLVSYADMMTLLMGFFALIASFSKPDAKEFDKVAAASSKFFGGKYEAPYEKLSQSMSKVIRENKLEDNVKIEVGPEGVEMTFTGTMFFDSGGIKVKEEAAELLNKLSGAIRKETSNFSAIIEGHTDNTPINHEIIASNWELSGIRAARIAKIFEDNGFSKKQLTIIGWGETRPIVSNENSDGTPNLENRTKNRRVMIRVYKEFENKSQARSAASAVSSAIPSEARESKKSESVSK